MRTVSKVFFITLLGTAMAFAAPNQRTSHGGGGFHGSPAGHAAPSFHSGFHSAPSFRSAPNFHSAPTYQGGGFHSGGSHNFSHNFVPSVGSGWANRGFDRHRGWNNGQNFGVQIGPGYYYNPGYGYYPPSYDNGYYYSPPPVAVGPVSVVGQLVSLENGSAEINTASGVEAFGVTANTDIGPGVEVGSYVNALIDPSTDDLLQIGQ